MKKIMVIIILVGLISVVFIFPQNSQAAQAGIRVESYHYKDLYFFKAWSEKYGTTYKNLMGVRKGYKKTGYSKKYVRMYGVGVEQYKFTAQYKVW